MPHTHPSAITNLVIHVLEIIATDNQLPHQLCNCECTKRSHYFIMSSDLMQSDVFTSILVYNEEYEGVWPITEEHIKILDINRCSLVELIDPSELINELFAKGVINQRHREHVESKKTAYKRSEALLDIVRRFSLSSFGEFQICLENTNQKHISRVFINGGGKFHNLLTYLLAIKV